MKKKERRSLEEILDSLKNAEKEFDEKLDKYGMKDIKPKNESSKEAVDNTQVENSDDPHNHSGENVKSAI